MDSSNSSDTSCGYDDNRFISPPADYLRCAICSLILRNPIQIVDCGHKYCSGCFQRWKASMERNNEPLRCPIDRNLVEITKVFEDIALKRLVGNLHVRCDQEARGCDWKGELSELQAHTLKCHYICQSNQQQAHEKELIGMLRKMGDRVEKLENFMEEKEKEVLHHRYTVTEMKTKYDRKLQEVEQLKKIVDEVKIENTSLRSKIQQNEQLSDQRLINMELKLSETSKNFGMLVKQVAQLETKNNVLEEEIKEYTMREELQELELTTTKTDRYDGDIVKVLTSGVSNVAAVSLAIGYPMSASVPHLIVNGFKNVAAVCLAADIDTHQIERIKDHWTDSVKSAAAAAPPPAVPAAAKEKGEESTDSESDTGFWLFG